MGKIWGACAPGPNVEPPLPAYLYFIAHFASYSFIIFRILGTVFVVPSSIAGSAIEKFVGIVIIVIVTF